MSQEERYGMRDLTYSAWHRVRSVSRFVGLEAAQGLKMVDQDVTLYLELESDTREPLCLVEVAIDVGQGEKPASSMARLAARANLPAFVVLYKIARSPNPADGRQFDIESFRIKRIWPAPENTWRVLSPEQWAKALLQIRSWSAARVEPANDALWEPIPRQVELFA